MKRWWCIFAMMAWVIAASAAEAPAKFGSLAAGTAAPEFTAIRPDGKELKLADLKGKIVVLNFWATNRGAASALEASATDYAALDVVVVGICSGATREEFDQAVEKAKGSISYLLAWDPVGKKREDGIAAKKFGIGALPATGVIDRDGKVVGGFTGFGAQSATILRSFLRTAGAAVAPEEKPAAAAGEEPPRRLLTAGAVAPDFTAADLAGRPVKLSDFAGKIVVLDFWATWCAPCLAAMPHTQQVAAAAQAKGVVVLAACTSDTRAAFETWVKANAASYPALIFANDLIGRDTPATYAERVSVKLYGVSGLPTVFVIGRDGKVADVFEGSGEGDTRLEEALTKLGSGFESGLRCHCLRTSLGERFEFLCSVILSAAKNPAGDTTHFGGADVPLDSSLRSE